MDFKLWYQEFEKFVEDFKKESDRSAVILGTAKLDIQLYQILRKVLRSTPSSRDDLLDDGRPLGTFSSRIDMAYRLGLITADFARELHLVRRIRDSFAHELSNATLKYGAYQDRLNEIVTPLVKYRSYRSLRKKLFGEKAGPSIDFRMAVANLFLLLKCVYFRFPQVDLGKPMDLVLPQQADNEELGLLSNP